MTLSASGENFTESGWSLMFKYRKTSVASWTSVAASSITATNASVSISGLEPGVNYTYCVVASKNGETDITSSSKMFTTVNTVEDWLELPATTTSSTTSIYQIGEGAERNYSFLYDKTKYASLWVAYPLSSEHMGSLSRDDSWTSYPGIDTQYQINIWSGSYGVSVATPNYPNNLYARGHQIPNADRNGNETMQSQTFYAINSTPQIQNGFNSGIWSSLEAAVRSAVPADDMLYVATGPVYQTVGGNEEITYITPNKDQTKSCPVPNYYYKVILKVKRTGDEITSASAIGFWLAHQEYSGSAYANYAVSVDEIEQMTGFDFFANLPDGIETAAEVNTSWSTFQSF